MNKFQNFIFNTLLILIAILCTIFAFIGGFSKWIFSKETLDYNVRLMFEMMSKFFRKMAKK